ncbi:MAG TPA: RNA polymerase sigma factor [Thermoleophilaceae bacterium]|jgi:RNA polymerase sigma-70 factor (ECF subfamily)
MRVGGSWASKGAAPPERAESRAAGRGTPLVRAGDERHRTHSILRSVERSSDSRSGSRASRLARRAQAGDDLAFAELYVEFFDRVHRYLLIALKSPDDAQEVAQEVFARALRRLDRFDHRRGEFRDWLFSMVRSVAIDHLRQGARAEEVEFRSIHAHALPVADRAASLLDRLDPESGVRSLIDGLPELQRRVLTLRFVFGFSTAEIGDVVGSTPDAVRHIQHRALKTLGSGMESVAQLVTRAGHERQDHRREEDHQDPRGDHHLDLDDVA